MSEKKETENNVTDEIPGNDSTKDSSDSAKEKFFPFLNMPMGIMGGRNVTLTVIARGNKVTSYALESKVGGGDGHL